ncbi:MAG: hydantoinase/oxoprolinase family protein, partial [Chloroflexi bacterium]|nr:hydantoinase/oxoprolinase family protein [Chloroflexota bacterium]
MNLGVDIGGTFTDFVVLDEGRLAIHKVLSTRDPAQGFLQGLRELAIPSGYSLVHGSTVATNAILERKGVRTALFATKGFGDVIEIGRQTRPSLYDFSAQRPPPFVPAELRFEVDERVDYHGHVLRPARAEQIDELVERLRAADAEAVAVSLLFSFVNPMHERLVAERIAASGLDVPVSLSHLVLPEYREYERTSTVVINAYVAPLIDRYLANLEVGLGDTPLRIMQSSGGSISAQVARRESVRTALSGPAGGVVGAFYVAQTAGYSHVITFDMGGTSTDVSLCPGHI